MKICWFFPMVILSFAPMKTCSNKKNGPCPWRYCKISVAIYLEHLKPESWWRNIGAKLFLWFTPLSDTNTNWQTNKKTRKLNSYIFWSFLTIMMFCTIDMLEEKYSSNLLNFCTYHLWPKLYFLCAKLVKRSHLLQEWQKSGLIIVVFFNRNPLIIWFLL